MIAKLNARGFDNKAMRFVYDYLTSRKHRTEISDTYSSWQEILSGVTQGSILGPLSFNIDISDLFFIMEDCDIANYADDNTPYLSEKWWASLERFTEFVVKLFSVVYCKWIERECKQMSFTDKFWWKCACKYRYITD